MPGNDQPTTVDRAGEFGRALIYVNPSGWTSRRAAVAAGLVVAPLVVGFLLGLPEAAVLVAIGALNLLLVESPYPAATPRRVLFAAAATNTAAFAAGTLVGLLPRIPELPFVAVGVFVALWASDSDGWQGTGFIAAVMFVFAVGVPPTTAFGVLLRPAAVLLGGVWVLSALAIASAISSRSPEGLFSPERRFEAGRTQPRSRSAVHAATVAVTAAVGLFVGVEFGLPRDYWVMLTVIVALRPSLAATLATSASRTVGTVVGAIGAFLVTTATSSPWFLFPVLTGSTGVAFATRGVNYLAYAVGITLTIIVLLNLVYSGGPSLAIARVLDTLLGGGLALGAAALLFELRPGARARRTG